MPQESLEPLELFDLELHLLSLLFLKTLVAVGRKGVLSVVVPDQSLAKACHRRIQGLVSLPL